ncbi:hypothetical protein [Peristeroidobacter agariperforans]|uniref:hypothetical protein n=1 Tax=Peristeroidobacter agariperforans TaxID=268404 RepID=UPI0013009FB7|nr:hypothetical protein [Peristeroidobacter agariperforans]
MTEKEDETLEVVEYDVKLIDLGDAVDETKQVVPHGVWPDCQFAVGARPGCG